MQQVVAWLSAQQTSLPEMKTFWEIWLSLFQESGRRAALNDCCGRHVTVKSNYLGCFIETTFFVRFIKMAFQPSTERTQILVHCFAVRQVRQAGWSIEVSLIYFSCRIEIPNKSIQGQRVKLSFSENSVRRPQKWKLSST